MKNLFFSLLIIPDDGTEVRQGSFNMKLAATLFATLVASFLICLFFIVGFHIKLYQEHDFRFETHRMTQLLSTLETQKATLSDLTHQLATVKERDKAFRRYAYMDLVDDSMYLAGIGGHLIVDEHLYDGLAPRIQPLAHDLLLTAATMQSRASVQEKSLDEIYTRVIDNNRELDSTPSILPTYSLRITDDYAYRTHPITGLREFHDAVDLAGRYGQRIFATANGVVTFAGYSGALGNYVKIRHQYGYETLYGHLSKILVQKGQEVKKGEVIGNMGSTGVATGNHLHYAVIQFGKKIDPKKYF